jgi:hypothetical protein
MKEFDSRIEEALRCLPGCDDLLVVLAKARAKPEAQYLDRLREEAEVVRECCLKRQLEAYTCLPSLDLTSKDLCDFFAGEQHGVRAW